MMKSEHKKDVFLKSIKQDLPAVKLFKYRYFIQNDKQAASEIRDQMTKIALDNNLIGEYRMIFQQLKESEVHNAHHLKLRQQMIQNAGTLQKMIKDYNLEKNNQEQAKALLKLGHLFFSYGDYKQCSQALNKITILKQGSYSVKYEEYANELALSYYYLNETYNLARFNSKPIQKSVLEKMTQLCIIRDINNITYKQNMDRPFDNVVKMGLSSLELSKNRVLGFDDLGFLYSLLSMAYKKKKDINFTKWSYKLENMFINNKYKAVLDTLQKQRQSRCHLPIINRVYEQAHTLIKSRIMTEIVSSFDRCPLKIIEEMTGMNQGQVKLFIKRSNENEFLYDPVTTSVVYRKNAPLFKEVNRLYNSLKAKFLEEQSSLSMRGDMDEDDEGQMGGIGKMGRIRSGDGGSGGMMGRMGIGRMGRFDF